MKSNSALDNQENSENDTLKAVHGIYLRTIAEKIKEEAEIKEGEFRKPIDTQAYRIACEYVANYLISQLMINSFEIVSKETDNYVRQRHDEAWLAKKLCLDETRNLFDQLMELCGEDKTMSTISSNAGSGRKMKPKVARRNVGSEGSDVPDTLQSKTQTTGDIQFLESQDFSQFTGILTTNAGAEYTETKNDVPLTGLTFTELATETTVTEPTYDPRGVNAKPALPKITKSDLVNSAFRANDMTTMGTQIDTIEDTKDYMEYKRMRNDLKQGGIINNDVTTMTEFDNQTTTESYLKPIPRIEPETIDETWEELERTQEDPTLNLGVCPFKKNFEDIVARKKKMVSMSVQAGGKTPIEPNFAPAPPLNPINFHQIDEDEDEAKDARKKLGKANIEKIDDELEP